MLGPWLYTTNSHVDKKETSLLAHTTTNDRIWRTLDFFIISLSQ